MNSDPRAYPDTRSRQQGYPDPAPTERHRRDGRFEELDGDQSLSELLGRLSEDTTEFLSAQVELAKAEVREEVQQVSRIGAAFGTAAVMGFVSLLLLAFAAAWGLTEIVPEGVAFLIVGVVVAILAGIAFMIGRTKLEQTDFVPRETVETLQEDVQWARQQMN